MIEAEAAAIQRSIYELNGHPARELAKLNPRERPRTVAAHRLFLHGEIGAARLNRINLWRQTIMRLLIRVALIAIVTLVLTWILSIMLNRLSKRYRDANDGNSAQTLLVLSFVRALGKLALWTTALIFILSSLGFNVAAILAGLGIGGLAVAMSARETLADMLGGIMLFIERPFVIGDTIQIGSGVTAKVVDMTWRTTRLVDVMDWHHSFPNSQVANSNIKNFSRTKPIADGITVYVSLEHDPETVNQLLDEAIQTCEYEEILPDGRGSIRLGIEPLGNMTTMKYFVYWYVDEYHSRYVVQSYVWAKCWTLLVNAGISMAINPVDEARVRELMPGGNLLGEPVPGNPPESQGTE